MIVKDHVFAPALADKFRMPPTALPLPEWAQGEKFPSKSSYERVIGKFSSLEIKEGFLSFAEEAEHYFRVMARSHFNQIDYFERDLARRYPPDYRTQTAIVIPCAAHEEATSIKRTLDEYVSSGLPDSAEIILFLNQPYGAAGNEDMRTAHTVRRYIENNPRVPLRVFSHTFENVMAIGQIKKILHDVAILRQLRSEMSDPLLILGDADVTRVQDNFLLHTVEPFSEPSVDVVTGHLDWDNTSYRQFPELHFAARFYQTVDAILNTSRGRKITSGAATAIRSSVYCLIGGTPVVERGEDIALGLAVESMRGTPLTVHHPSQATAILESSNRRSVAAYQRGFAPNEKWKMGFSIVDPSVRKNGEKRAQMMGLQRITERVMNGYDGDNIPPAFFEKCLGTLGVVATVHESCHGRSLASADFTIAVEAMKGIYDERP